MIVDLQENGNKNFRKIMIYFLIKQMNMKFFYPKLHTDG